MQLFAGLVWIFASVVWRLLIAATLVFLMRILWTGLWRRYPSLTAFLVADVIQQTARLLFPEKDAFLYEIGNAIKVSLLIAVLWEMTRAGFEHHPALARFSRQTSWNVIGVCAVLGAINLFLDPALSSGRSPVLHYFLLVERAITTCLLVFVMVVAGFIAWFPVPMRRNAAWFLSGFCLIFSATWVSLLVSNRSPDLARSVSGTLADGVSMICLICWTLAINPAGETVAVTTGRSWNESEITRVRAQMDAIHQSVVRLSQ